MNFAERNINIQDMNKFNDEAVVHNAKIIGTLKFGDDLVRFNLSEALTVSEHSELDDFISSYQDRDPEGLIPKIYDLVKDDAKKKHFHNIDYIKDIESMKNLIPKRTVSHGEVRKVEWFRTLNVNQEPEDLVLVVDISYTRDGTGFALYRNTVRKWINRDGSENSELKTTTKFYFINPSDMITEGYKRRKLLVQSIQIPTLTFMTEVLSPLGYSQEAIVLKGRAFMDEYESDFSKFIENSSTVTDPSDDNVGKKTVIVKLENDDISGVNADYNEWLDKAPPSLGGLTTIRQYLINEFNI